MAAEEQLLIFAAVALSGICVPLTEQVTHREGPVAQGEINLSAKYMNNRLTLEADPYKPLVEVNAQVSVA